MHLKLVSEEFEFEYGHSFSISYSGSYAGKEHGFFLPCFSGRVRWGRGQLLGSASTLELEKHFLELKPKEMSPT